MKQRIYITYCCKSKKRISKNSKVAPDELYTSSRIKSFIDFCNKHKFSWAIFSDEYGLVFKNDTIGWYDKAPDEVTEIEYNNLLSSTICRLQNYETVFFYYCEESFHPLYRRLFKDIKEHINIFLFDNLEEMYAKN